jgi:hypothetical protein
VASTAFSCKNFTIDIFFNVSVNLMGLTFGRSDEQYYDEYLYIRTLIGGAREMLGELTRPCATWTV